MSSYAPLMELIKGAKKVMDLHVKPGEDVLIVTTTDQQAVVPNALALAAQAAGANEVVVAAILPRSASTPDVPRSVAEAAKGADIVFTTTTSSLAFSSLTRLAAKSGGKLRHISMDLVPDQLKSGGIMANYNKIREVTLKLCKIMEKAKKGKVVTDAGTDVAFGMGRSCCEFYGIPHGTGAMPWWAGAPDGETMTAIFEDTAEGRIVVDRAVVSSYTPLPSCILSQPIELKVSKGTVTDIKGGAEAATLRKVLEASDANAWRLCEFAFGTNPLAEYHGRHEDKKRLGTCHFAIGGNDTFGGKIKCKVHVDLVVDKPTIVLDSKTIMSKGELLV